MTQPDIKARIRAHHKLADSTPVGVRGSFGHDVKVDTEKGNRSITLTANTDDIDNDAEVVMPAGADLTYFEANKSIFVDHEYTHDKWVGKMRRLAPVKIGDEHRAWKVVMQARRTPLGDEMLTVAREMGIGCSIGFVPEQYGPPQESDPDRYKSAASVVRAWKWLELSLTPLPCNVSCQSDAERVDESKASDLERLVTKGLIRRETAAMFGLPGAGGGVDANNRQEVTKRAIRVVSLTEADLVR